MKLNKSINTQTFIETFHNEILYKNYHETKLKVKGYYCVYLGIAVCLRSLLHNYVEFDSMLSNGTSGK